MGSDRQHCSVWEHSKKTGIIEWTKTKTHYQKSWELWFSEVKGWQEKKYQNKQTTTTKRKANLRSRGKNGYPVITDRNRSMIILSNVKKITDVSMRCCDLGFRGLFQHSVKAEGKL